MTREMRPFNTADEYMHEQVKIWNSQVQKDDVKLNDHVELCGQMFFLTHRPKDHDKHCQTLFGHIHRGGGLYRPYGFNVGTDLYNYRLVDENVIKDLLERKLWWDDDIDIASLNGR